MPGTGIYKSINGGETWNHLGLNDSWHIGEISINPSNPNIVFVSVMGHFWSKNNNRGVYRTTNGGKSWKKVLYVDEMTGANDIVISNSNPNIIYASLWENYPGISGRKSGIYKSIDNGETWNKMESGLPYGDKMGRIGLAVSHSNPDKVYALIDNLSKERNHAAEVYSTDNGGINWYRTHEKELLIFPGIGWYFADIYVNPLDDNEIYALGVRAAYSNDGGKSFKSVNSDRTLIARSWYYIHVFADPQDENIVYVLNAPFLKSTDGGKSFTRISVPHGDNHGLWVNPTNNKNMINANDGGANISFNGGQSWSTQKNQPTAQFYRVITDNRFPYYVYAGQQDNSSVAVPNRTNGRGIDWSDWYSAAGCESAYLAFDPDNPVEVYGGCYQGLIEKLNVVTRKSRSIMAFEYLGLGSVPKDQKYRFNWNAPIFASPHDPTIIYHAGNVLFKTADGGDSWEIISPDLTKNDVKKHDLGSIAFTNEAAGGEVYNTIMYAVESIHEQGVIWAGSDDGLIHLTQDGGKNWNNVTPKGMKEGIVNSIEVSQHDKGTVYVAFTRYKFGDLSPSIYKTTNYINLDMPNIIRFLSLNFVYFIIPIYLIE